MKTKIKVNDMVRVIAGKDKGKRGEIVRVDLNTNDFEIAAQKTYAVLKDDSGRLRLQVWNMGDSAKTGHLEVVGAKLKGLPAEIVLGPRGTPPAAFDCLLVPDEASDYKQKLEVFGVFGGKRSSSSGMDCWRIRS